MIPQAKATGISSRRVTRFLSTNTGSSRDLISVKSAFISHSSADDRYVTEFVQLVRSLGFDEVFNDSHIIEPDEIFWERIEQGILECNVFVVILSHASVESCWVDREVQFARQKGKRVLPVHIDDCPLPPSFDGRDVIELKLSGKGQRISPPRFLHHSAELFLGREAELAMLDNAWAAGINVLSLIAWGGVGKTSLIAEWIQTRFIDRQWKDANGKPDPLAYFDWSFYEQGTQSFTDESCARTGNVGDFFEQALVFFGDRKPSDPGKGSRLADLVRQQRTLFILDGLEPLQQPVGHSQAGRLIDPDLRDFLLSLTAFNPGLCLITSRQVLKDLHGLHNRAAVSQNLEELPMSVAVRLLQEMGVKGSYRGLEAASAKFGCHALSLTLLGRFLVDAHHGDVVRIDTVRDLHRADDLTRGDRHRTAWKVLAAYDEWLATAQSDSNPRTLAVLRLTGLFDRAATCDCLSALRAQPVIPGLTNSICGIADDEWNILLKGLDRANLIKLTSQSNQLGIDAHPLVRNYFAHKLNQTEPAAWKAAHRRLFEHLCETTKEGDEPTLEDLQPLYQAVAHGCQAGLVHQVCADLFVSRIRRGKASFSCRFLGAFCSDLQAINLILETAPSTDSRFLTLADRGWLLGEAAICLRAISRSEDALSMLRESLEIAVELKRWDSASIRACTLSYLELTVGELSEAIQTARKGVGFAELATLEDDGEIGCANNSERNVEDVVPRKGFDTVYGLQVGFKSRTGFLNVLNRSRLADAMHQSGCYLDAMVLFAETEATNAEKWGEFPLLVSGPGNRYCDLLLSEVERYIWRVLLMNRATCSNQDMFSICRDVENRARKTLGWAVSLAAEQLSFAFDKLTIARCGLYIAIIQDSSLETYRDYIDDAVDGFRRAGTLDQLPTALLVRGCFRFLSGVLNGPDSAQSDLDEAWEIAERGPMQLFLADIHLHRARLFSIQTANVSRPTYPWVSPQQDLASARRLIERHGYGRRLPELEDAESAIN